MHVVCPTLLDPGCEYLQVPLRRVHNKSGKINVVFHDASKSRLEGDTDRNKHNFHPQLQLPA